MAVKSVGGSPAPPPKVSEGSETKEVDKSKKASESASPESSAGIEKPAAGPASTETQKSEKKLQEQTKAASLLSKLSDGASAFMDSVSAYQAVEQKPLKQGDSGKAVELYQHKLNAFRADHGKPALKSDGKFGDDTATAVKEFQKANGLTPDGLLGPKTRDRLTLETDASFKSLDKETKDYARDAMKFYSDIPDARAGILSAATDPNLKSVPKEDQPVVLDWSLMSKGPDDQAKVHSYLAEANALKTDPNFLKLNDATKEQIQQIHKGSIGDPDTSSNVLQFATDPNFGKLSVAHQDAALKAFQKNSTDAEFTKNLKGLVGSQSFQKLDDGVKTKILDIAAKKPNESFAADMQAITSDPAFGGMGVKDQAKVLNVVQETGPAARAALIESMKRDVNGTPALLAKGPGNTGTTLDQLDRLASTNLDARLVDGGGNPVSKNTILTSVLAEVADPYGTIEQSSRGTCPVTSLSHKLSLQQPAEYARLVTDLATTGTSKLQNGDTIQVPAADSWQTDNSQRSNSERLLQSALMDYGRPGKGYQNWNAGADGVRGTVDDGFADPTNPAGSRALDGFPDRNTSGLTDDEFVRVLKGVYGQEYQNYSGSANLRNDKGDMIRKSEQLLQDGKGPVLIGMAWAGGGHVVEITDIRDGKVFYRNPWGPNGMPGADGTTVGTSANTSPGGPLRTVENGAKAIESMALGDFKTALSNVYVPVY